MCKYIKLRPKKYIFSHLIFFLPYFVNVTEVKTKVSIASPDIQDILQPLPVPLARWEPMHPVTIDSALGWCTRYLLWLSGPRQVVCKTCQTCPHQKLNPRPFDLPKYRTLHSGYLQ